MQGIFCKKLLQLPEWLATLLQRMACSVLHLPGDNQIPDDEVRNTWHKKENW
jgi:hypothetical protein